MRQIVLVSCLFLFQASNLYANICPGGLVAAVHLQDEITEARRLYQTELFTVLKELFGEKITFAKLTICGQERGEKCLAKLKGFYLSSLASRPTTTKSVKTAASQANSCVILFETKEFASDSPLSPFLAIRLGMLDQTNQAQPNGFWRVFLGRRNVTPEHARNSLREKCKTLFSPQDADSSDWPKNLADVEMKQKLEFVGRRVAVTLHRIALPWFLEIKKALEDGAAEKGLAPVFIDKSAIARLGGCDFVDKDCERRVFKEHFSGEGAIFDAVTMGNGEIIISLERCLCVGKGCRQQCHEVELRVLSENVQDNLPCQREVIKQFLALVSLGVADFIKSQKPKTPIICERPLPGKLPKVLPWQIASIGAGSVATLSLVSLVIFGGMTASTQQSFDQLAQTAKSDADYQSLKKLLDNGRTYAALTTVGLVVGSVAAIGCLTFTLLHFAYERPKMRAVLEGKINRLPFVMSPQFLLPAD